MVKLRHAGYCNLKVLLLFMVVYGHWIENRIDSSAVLHMQYRLIYFVHMPLFVFLSGLFIRNGEDCLRQVKRLGPLYVGLQLVAVSVSGGAMDIWTPFWHLWYLLSFCWWAMAGWLWFWIFEDKSGGFRGRLQVNIVSSNVRRKTVQVGALLSTALLGALAGFIPWLDRTVSGSRTVVFFPYFLAGLMCRADVSWEKYRKQGCAALAAAVVMILIWGEEIPVQFLYHAEPYNVAEQGIAMQEAVQRIMCYVISSFLCFFLLSAIPRKRFPFTRAGADTMPGYLVHAPVVGVLRELSLPWGACLAGSALLLYIIYKIFQWRSPLYGIVSSKVKNVANCKDRDIAKGYYKERRDKMWPHFRKFTRSTENPYTDFFWP